MARTGARRRVRHDVADLMTLLGDSDCEVAQRLTADGVIGHPGSETDCAVAVYLGGALSDDRSIRSLAVSGRAVWVHRRRSLLPVVVSIPGPVAAFIRGFDRGDFPHLEAPFGERALLSWGPRHGWETPHIAASPRPGRWHAEVARAEVPTAE